MTRECKNISVKRSVGYEYLETKLTRYGTGPKKVVSPRVV